MVNKWLQLLNIEHHVRVIDEIKRLDKFVLIFIRN